jgi:DNA polymerase
MIITDCERCERAKGRIQVVRSYGNKNADLLFIGEAPGREEDEIGKPFVGKCGTQVYEGIILKGLGLTREEVRTTNVNRCRPGSNRTPTEEEMLACSVWLRKEIEVVKPRIIVVMGNPALKIITNKTGITGFRGAFFASAYSEMLKRNFRNVFAMLHPASLYYGNKEDRFIKKRWIIQDTRRLRQLYG